MYFLSFIRFTRARRAKQEAVMVTARKMLKVVYWMLRDMEPYHPGLDVYDPMAGSC